MEIEISYAGDIELGELKDTLTSFKEEKVAERIWQKDYTVWKNNPQEISNRLGWLTAPEWTINRLSEIEEFVESVRREGFQRVLLLGMGGSTLAAEVIAGVFGVKHGYLPLSILDTTDPILILRERHACERSKTLIIVSSKSGTTVETDSLMKYFYRLLVTREGAREAPRCMVAITDPGSGLEEIAREFRFRQIFLNDPDIGGRFSALSFVGMVPAALSGLDCRLFLETATQFSRQERERGGDAISARLGVFLGHLASKGRDKLTLFVSHLFPGLGAWLEQLVAESTGKEGKGILPVEEEPSLPHTYFGPDRVFVQIEKSNESPIATSLRPRVNIEVPDLIHLSSLFFLWEFATAVAGWKLGVNPFDQPNVEEAKRAAREALKQDTREESPDATIDDIEIYGIKRGSRLAEFLDEMIGEDTSYIALQVYLTPTASVWKGLEAIKRFLLHRYGKVVTIGIGPRYLHSTGQLHKGDGGKGVFLQFTESVTEDVPIPDRMGEEKSSLTFGILRLAQARGDFLALTRAQRRVMRFHFPFPGEEGLTKLVGLL
ncbi:MAG: hypothetical protein N2572_06585 [Syntrophales bacterium]|nr:hypothetical protein [Syntrophales bacterium]